MKTTIAFIVKEIEHNSFHPLIQGEIDGQPINLILDTGASRTVFDRAIALRYPTLKIEGNELFAAGINAQKIEVEQVEIPAIYLGDVLFNDMQVFCSDLEPISKLFEDLTGIKIHGLLGCDFLEENKAIVNFKTRKIMLNKNNL